LRGRRHDELLLGAPHRDVERVFLAYLGNECGELEIRLFGILDELMERIFTVFPIVVPELDDLAYVRAEVRQDSHLCGGKRKEDFFVGVLLDIVKPLYDFLVWRFLCLN
jgi:hypothetical protein